jgi:hypothetical protein
MRVNGKNFNTLEECIPLVSDFLLANEKMMLNYVCLQPVIRRSLIAELIKGILTLSQRMRGTRTCRNDFYPVLLNKIFKLPVRPNLTQGLNPFPAQQADTQQLRQSPNDHV